MIELVENDKVGVIIAKDMSRIGRNYLEVGLYTEMLFPEHDIRFIAVNSGVDSANQQDNDFTPFLNIINEFYVKDSSKKVKAVIKIPTIQRDIGLWMMKPQLLSVRSSHGVWRASAPLRFQRS